MLSDPKVIIILLVAAALATFIYFSWRKTTESLMQLETSQKRLQRQLAHGVISEEKINPLRLENASNMSDETMDYDYPDDEHDDQQQHDQPHDQHQQHQQHPQRQHDQQHPQHPQHKQHPQHQQHQQHEQDQRPVPESETESDFERYYGEKPLPPRNTIPGSNMIDELRGYKDDEDIVIIHDDDYSEGSEEPIEFNDIDDTNDEGMMSLMQQEREQLIQQKIRQDMTRMDNENQRLMQMAAQAHAAQTRPAPLMAPAPASASASTSTSTTASASASASTSASTSTAPSVSSAPSAALSTSSKIKIQPQPKPKHKTDKAVEKEKPAKPKIQPKIKNIEVKV